MTLTWVRGARYRRGYEAYKYGEGFVVIHSSSSSTITTLVLNYLLNSFSQQDTSSNHFQHFQPHASPTKPAQSKKTTNGKHAIPIHCPCCRHGFRCCCRRVSDLELSISLSMLKRHRTVTVYACPSSTSTPLGVASSTPGVASATIASTGVVTAPTATGSPITYATGAASLNGVSALGLFVAGGVALVRSTSICSSSLLT